VNKIDFRTVDKAAKSLIRKRAIDLIKHSNHNQKQIAEILGVSENSVSTWSRNYKQLGNKGLKEKPRGRKQGEKRLLSLEQEKSIQKMIVDKMPDQLKLPYALWTRKAIVELVKTQFNITITQRTMGDYLARWGFTPQKPKKKAYEQNPKAVNKWLNEQYPAIVKSAKAEGAQIHWGDETGIKNDCQHGRSYSPKGKTPVKTKMSKKLSVNMISTVTNQGKVRFMTYKGNMDAGLFIDFMKRLIKTASQKIYLILDNLRVHHSKLVKAWVEENSEKIALFYLPSYSPEMNPDEYLNCDLKQGISNRPMAKNEEELTKHVRSHMRLLQNNPTRVSKYFEHKDIKYAAA